MKNIILAFLGVFVMFTTTYSQTQDKAVGDIVEFNKLLPTPNGHASQRGYYGTSVLGYDNKVMIGAPNNAEKGVVYIYEKINSAWMIKQIIKGEDMGEDINSFGNELSISGNRVLIGAINKAFVLELNNSDEWVKTATLSANDTDIQDVFGRTLFLEGNRAVISAKGFNNKQGAVYVFEYSLGTWVQTQKITADNASQGDEFGASISLFGDRLLIGAPEVGLANNNSGVAYVFEFNSTSWNQVQIIVPIFEVDQIQKFGISVVLDGDIAFIGAKYGNGQTTNSGAIHIFELQDIVDNIWNQVNKIFASDGESLDSFGESIAKKGNRLLISASGDDDNGNDSGAAYIFDFVEDQWLEIKKIKPNDGEDSDNFSAFGSIELTGDSVFIGSPLSEEEISVHSSGSAYVFGLVNNVWTETNKFIPNESAAEDFFGDTLGRSNDMLIVGTQSDNAELGSGSAYIYKYDGAVWALMTKLETRNEAYSFGKDVDILGNRAVVCASDEVYVFEYNGSEWLQTEVLTAGAPGDFFGFTISLGVDRVVVGATSDGDDRGAVYVFDYDLNTKTWSESAKLIASDGQQDDFFGYALSLNGNNLMVGQHLSVSNASPYQVYVFEYNGTIWQEVQILTASNAMGNNNFGGTRNTIDLKQNIALIGASANISAYIFEKIGNSWVETTILNATDDNVSDFGRSVSIDGDSALVGAATKGFVGNDKKGAAYLFKLNNNAWSQTQILRASDASFNDRFGIAVSLQNNNILVGAYQDDDYGNDSGSIYVFGEVGDLIFKDGFDL